MRYNYLEGKIAERGIKKTDIAKAIGIVPRTLSNKLNGTVAFSWNEVIVIRDEFFPEESLEALFKASA